MKVYLLVEVSDDVEITPYAKQQDAIDAREKMWEEMKDYLKEDYSNFDEDEESLWETKCYSAENNYDDNVNYGLYIEEQELI